ncbi:MAG: aspartate aminotransferase family protein [Alphaproteobacteria bacterium]|nr:aspartate aminotransferase family protein [Alphaproteobacteria bacterium]
MFPSVLPTYNRADVAFVRGEGPYLFAEDGRRFLDFGAGIAVNAFGHANPTLVAALTEQSRKLWHTSNLYRVPGQEELSRKLVESTFADTVFFTNSGAEACECAFKMARRYQYVSGHPERYRIVTFEGAFHGRTLAGIAAGGQAKYLEGFGPKVDGFDQVPPNDLAALERVLGDETAALMIEPIQGEGGLNPVPAGFLRALRRICDERGLLLIFDEIQTGVGRTGKLFAYEWLGIAPDIMPIAKGIGGGYPLGACLATAEAAKGMTVGTHGSTYGGNPLGMAVGSAALDLVLAPGFLEHVRKVSNYLNQQLGQLLAAHPDVFESVRGQGLMLGLKMRVPNTDFVARARDEGLLVVGAGDNVVRLLPPLIIEEAQVREAVEKLSAAASTFEAARAKAAQAVA